MTIKEKVVIFLNQDPIRRTWSTKRIAEELGVSISAVSRNRGKKVWANEIVFDYLNQTEGSLDEPCEEIAEKLGIGYQVVYRIKREKFGWPGKVGEKYSKILEELKNKRDEWEFVSCNELALNFKTTGEVIKRLKIQAWYS